MRAEHRHAPPGRPGTGLSRLVRALGGPLAGVAILLPGPAGAVPLGPIPNLPGLTIGVGVPAAPEPSATGTFASVRLAWTPGEAGGGPILRYTVYRGLSPLALLRYAEVDASAEGSPAGFVDRSADLGATYHYAVTASNALGESPRSETVSASPMPVGTLFATAKWTGRDDAYDIAMLAGGVVTKINADDGDHQTPAVAPDGSAIAYTSNHGNGPGDYDLWLKRPGAAAVRLTSGPDADAEPAFSPDGSRVAFTRLAHGRPSIWTVPVAGGEPRRVPQTDGLAMPSWSPNGRMLAVAKVLGVETSLVVLNLDGTVRRHVAGTVSREVPAFDPSFSPDGTTLSFVRATPGGGVVATVPAAGGTVTDLTGGGLAVAAQQWAPAGDRIVFEGYSETTAGTMWSVDPGSGTVKPLAGVASEAGLSPTPAEEPAVYSPLPVPGAPTVRRATLGRDSVTLRWSPPSDAEAGTWYVVRRSAPGEPAPQGVDDGTAVYSGTATTATASGLEHGQRYSFAVFAMSGSGDPGGSAVRAARAAVVPVVRPAAGVVATSPGAAPEFLAVWQGPLADGQSYEVQAGTRRFDARARRWGPPAYRTIAHGRATSAVVTAAPGATYHLRARVRDADGNATPWSSDAVTSVPYDDRAMTGTGTWRELSGQPGRFAGTLRTSRAAGATLTMRAWGSTFALLADRCRACGTLEIHVDGRRVATVDTHARRSSARQVVWATAFDRIGRHTVTVVVVGTGEHRLVRVDGFLARR